MMSAVCLQKLEVVVMLLLLGVQLACDSSGRVFHLLQLLHCSLVMSAPSNVLLMYCSHCSTLANPVVLPR